MRTPSTSDFTVTLPNVGDFVFGRRTIGDSLKIRAEFVRIAGPDGDADGELSLFGGFLAAYSVLAVSCPPGWEDPKTLDDDQVVKILELHTLLREKEDSFRRPAAEDSKA